MRALVDTSASESFLVAAGDVFAGRLDPVAAWAGYEGHHGNLFDRYFDRWGDAQARLVAATAMVQTAERIAAAGLDWHGLLDDVAARMTALRARTIRIPRNVTSS